LPLRNENGKELPVSRGISGGFNEALGFFRKKKKIVRPTILGKAKDWGRGQRAEGRGQRAELRDQRLSSNDRKYGVWGFWPHGTTDPAPIAKASRQLKSEKLSNRDLLERKATI
jgi:hypothetical protein